MIDKTNVHSISISTEDIMKEEIQDKKAAVLKAALQLISEQGFHGTPMSQISKKANVSIGTIYHYFASKEDLLNALYIDVKRRLADYALENYAGSTPVRKAFKHLFSRVIHYTVENPAELSFAEQYENSPLITGVTREEGARISKPIEDLFRRAADQDLLKDLTLQMMGALIISAVIGLSKLYLSGALKLEEESLDKALDAIWDMIKR